MIDLKKSETTALTQAELREITATNRQLQRDLDNARYKLQNELDTLKYKLDKIAYETEEIRREVRDINHVIDKLRYDLLDAVRNNKTDTMFDTIIKFSPLLIMGMPIALLIAVIVRKFLLP